jgi:hypothetical protein
MNAFPHQERADGGLRPGARTLRGRHSILVQVAGNGVGGRSQIVVSFAACGTTGLLVG